MALLHWALNVVIATFVLLLLAILLWFVWNALMGVFHGPQLSYEIVAIVSAIVAISAGNWTLFRFRTGSTT